MSITRTVAAVGVAGIMGLTGLGAVAVAAPASTAAGEGSDGLVAALRGALDGLVGDGTLTGEQADAVAGTLAESGALRHGGHSGRAGLLLDLEVAATTLGLSAEELRTALSADGATLAGLAADQGVETQGLVDALVAAATERIETAVTDGRLAREEADKRLADLPARVAAAVEEELRLGHRHGGHSGHGGHDGPGRHGGPGWLGRGDGGNADDDATPDATPDATTPGDGLIPGPDDATGTLGRSVVPRTGLTT